MCTINYVPAACRERCTNIGKGVVTGDTRVVAVTAAPLNDHLCIFSYNFLNFYNIIDVIILKL